MKLKKNRFCAAIVLILIMGLLAAGCSKETKKETKEDTKKTEATDKEKSDTKKTEETKTEEKEVEIPYEKGVRTDSGYESAWMNMRYTLPENATLASDEQIQQMYNTGAKAMGLGESEDVQNVCEMLAIGADGSTNVSVAAAKLPISTMSEDTYLSVSMKSLVQMGSNFSYQINGDITDEVIFGQNFKKGSVTGVYQDITMSQEMYVRKIGSYVVLITISYTGDGAEKDVLMSGFQPYA